MHLLPHLIHFTEKDQRGVEWKTAVRILLSQLGEKRPARMRCFRGNGRFEQGNGPLDGRCVGAHR